MITFKTQSVNDTGLAGYRSNIDQVKQKRKKVNESCKKPMKRNNVERACPVVRLRLPACLPTQL